MALQDYTEVPGEICPHGNDWHANCSDCDDEITGPSDEDLMNIEENLDDFDLDLDGFIE